MSTSGSSNYAGLPTAPPGGAAPRSSSVPVYSFVTPSSSPRAIRARISRLRRCLSALTARQSRALELRAGLSGQPPLEPGEIAARLRLGKGAYAELEASALGRLQRASGDSGCLGAPTGAGVAGAGQTAHAALSSVSLASGGVLGVRYAKAQSSLQRRSAGSSPTLFGAKLSPTARTAALVVILAALAAALVIGFLFLDGLGAGPRHRRWQRRRQRG